MRVAPGPWACSAPCRASVPPCSRLSRTGPAGGRRGAPVLASAFAGAAARGGPHDRRTGRRNAPRGPNQGMGGRVRSCGSDPMAGPHIEEKGLPLVVFSGVSPNKAPFAPGVRPAGSDPIRKRIRAGEDDERCNTRYRAIAPYVRYIRQLGRLRCLNLAGSGLDGGYPRGGWAA
jgi:hypothetical protein